MREHLGFLRISSVVVKSAAWIFLFLGVIGGFSAMLGRVHILSRWEGAVLLAVYTFLFFFLYLIAKIADLLIKIIHKLNNEDTE